MVEREFTDAMQFPVDEAGARVCHAIVDTNLAEQVLHLLQPPPDPQHVRQADRLPLGRLTAQSSGTFTSCVLTWTGLGPDADVRLLGKLASQTQGEFFPIANARDLLKEFVSLASQVGRFWRRDQA